MSTVEHGYLGRMLEDPVRYLLYTKIENIIKEMHDQENGLNPRSAINLDRQVHFELKNTFTGSELVGWVVEHLHTDSVAEAVHIVGLMCHIGYVLSISDNRNVASIKEDSSLFQFQTPYYWPSVNWRPDLIEYAIYLTKRNLRNKQKHGLDEHEQTMLSKLQKIYCDKWDFIAMQAELQLKLLKEKNKPEKSVLSNQERTFWRIHWPLPGHHHNLKVIRRNIQSEHLGNKRSIDVLRKEVALLKSSLKVLKMKLSKVFESYVNQSELYREYDAFLEAPLPSNPWISDDLSMWATDSVLDTTLSKKRVKKWSFGLKELLKDSVGIDEFKIFLDTEFSSENIEYWLAVQEFKCLPLQQLEAKAQNIYKEFMVPAAPSEINIDSITMNLAIQQLSKPHRLMFDGAQTHIFQLMKKDTYPRFIRSEQYKNLLSTASNPVTARKKLFQFTSTVPNSKKGSSPLPSPVMRRRHDNARRVDNRFDENGELSGSSDSPSPHSSIGNLSGNDVPVTSPAVRSPAKHKYSSAKDAVAASFNEDIDDLTADMNHYNVITPWDDM